MYLAQCVEGIQIGQKQVHQSWLELVPAALTDGVCHHVGRSWFFVAELRAQGVKYICQRGDARRNRYIGSRQSIGVSSAIPTFVVREGNFCRHFHQRALRPLQYVQPELRVLLHEGPLIRAQFAGFMQDGVGDSHFTDVVRW